MSEEARQYTIEEALSLAHARYKAGHTAQAASICMAILDVSPAQLSALQLLWATLEQEQSSLLESYIQNAIGSCEPCTTLCTYLGLVKIRNNKPSDARTAIQKALELDQTNAIAHNAFGILLQNEKDFDLASSHYKEAIKNNPNYVEPRINLAILLQSQGLLREAIDLYNLILEIDPENEQALYNLAVAYQGDGALQNAISVYQEVLKVAPGNYRAYYNIGSALIQFGKPADAINYFHQALKINPIYPEALNNLGGALLEIGEFDQAESFFKAAICQQHDYAEANFNIHVIQLDRRQIRDAIISLKNANESNPSNMKYKFFLGLCLDYMGNISASRREFAQIPERDTVYASLDAWKYFKSAKKGTPVLIGTGVKIFELAMNESFGGGLILEFGVRFGTSIRQIAKLTSCLVHGFDSFEGLPEAWHDEPKGSYSTNGQIPQVPDNVRLYKGWFDDSIPDFLMQVDGNVSFINIDCDIYSSTKIILTCLTQRIVTGTIIVFDEYIGNKNWRVDEYKAFQEWVIENHVQYEYLAVSHYTKQVVVRILKFG